MQSPFDEYVAWMMNFAKEERNWKPALWNGIEILLGLVMNGNNLYDGKEWHFIIFVLYKTCKHYAIYQYIFEYICIYMYVYILHI